MELIANCMVPAMEVGRLFECEEYFVPELLAAGAEPAGRIVIDTMKGDLHDIGKDLVASILEGGGFARNADIVCLSALLTMTIRRFVDEIGADAHSDNASVAVTLARDLAAAAQPGVLAG
jgi:5-methyltetrahydrofolate--homocysteine methyltransferase